MVTKRPTMFRTIDGCEFLTEQEAERYEELIEAKTKWERARAAFGRALAATQKTADGQPFDPEREHWQINDGIWGMPTLVPMAMPGVWTDFEWEADEDSFYITTSTWDGKGHDHHRFLVSELYASQRAGTLALIALRETRVAEFVADTAAMREGLNLA